MKAKKLDSMWSNQFFYAENFKLFYLKDKKVINVKPHFKGKRRRKANIIFLS